MPKHLFKDNGMWKDKNNGNQEFKGHCTKDLDVGDRYEDQDEHGNKRLMEVKEKYQTEHGAIIVRSVGTVMN